MSGIKLLIFLSTVREPRNADRVLRFVNRLATEKGFVVDVIDPLKENLPLIENPLHFYPDQSKAPPQLHALNQKVISADAFLFVSTEYNFGVPPALLNVIDYVPPPSFAFKPAGIITYSIGNGGKIASSHLLDTLVYLGCQIQPFIVNITSVEKSINQDGQVLGGYWEDNIKTLLDQIEFTGTALKNQMQSGKLKQPRLNNFY